MKRRRAKLSQLEPPFLRVETVLIAGLAVVALLAELSGCARRRVVVHTPPPTVGTSVPSPPGPASPTRTPPKPPRADPVPGRPLEEGVASWYGVPFHGRRTASGEVYDMEKRTAAHRTLPFETIVRVINLRNGRQTEVRINDRGPFVEDRVIDLSLAAARELDMVATGVVPVRLELLTGPHPLSSFFTVQLAAFQSRDNAVRYRRQLEARYQPVYLHEFNSPRGVFYRVRVGRVGSEAEARRLAEQLRQEHDVTPFVVRLDE